jgi:hypothetical protein
VVSVGFGSWLSRRHARRRRRYAFANQTAPSLRPSDHSNNESPLYPFEIGTAKLWRVQGPTFAAASHHEPGRERLERTEGDKVRLYILYDRGMQSDRRLLTQRGTRRNVGLPALHTLALRPLRARLERSGSTAPIRSMPAPPKTNPSYALQGLYCASIFVLRLNSNRPNAHAGWWISQKKTMSTKEDARES